MLRPAVSFIPDLNWLYQDRILKNEHRMYFHNPGFRWGPEITPDTWNSIQFVSHDGEKVIGYFSCRFDRNTKTAHDIEAVNFYPQCKAVFGLDLRNFAVTVFNTMGMNRMVWDVIVGNPAEQMYDRIVQRFGGRIVGTFRQSAMTPDGVLHNQKYYEMFRDDFNNNLPNSYRKGVIRHE